MIARYKKLRFAVIVILLLLTMSCNIEPYVGGTTATPPPTDILVGPYVVNVKNVVSKELINNVTFWIGSEFVANERIVVDDDGYHLFCGYGELLSVWVDGFFINQRVCRGETEPVEIFLDRYQLTDNANYVWTSSTLCAGCHINRTDDKTGRYHDEYTEWQRDPHSNSFYNPYFQSVYLGTNGHPGFLADYPSDFGNCAFCHVPAILDPPQREADLKNFFVSQPSPATEGVTCDVCHKVVSVNLQRNGGDQNKPYHDRPGVLAYNFLRPDSQNERVYVGPRMNANLENFSNTNPPNSKITYSPVYERSDFCAPCHYGKFWDVAVYNSYGEWQASAYPGEGKACQDCHMKPGYLCEQNDEIRSEFTHDMTVENCMLKNTASMNVKAKYDNKEGRDRIAVTVTLTNENAGHNFPTDSPLRHLILFIEAKDQYGNVLPQVGGETIPLWGGVGSFAGQPGKIFANLLIEESFDKRQADLSPTIAYWNKTKQAWKNSDNRLRPKTYNAKEEKVEFVPDESKYFFSAPFPTSGGMNVTVTVRLYYRYEFFNLKIQKGWNRQDILLKEWIGVVQ
jgi:hypothetical protein